MSSTSPEGIVDFLTSLDCWSALMDFSKERFRVLAISCRLSLLLPGPLGFNDDDGDNSVSEEF
jgi:hypothetical protein